MSTGKPLLVSYYRLKEPEEDGSQDSSDNEGSNMEPKYKFYIRYNPKDFSTLSVEDRNRILINIFLKSTADKRLEDSQSTSPISPSENTSSSSPRALKAESINTESPPKISFQKANIHLKASSPHSSKRSSSSRELRQPSPKRVLLPREVRQPSPKRVLLPREARQPSPKRVLLPREARQRSPKCYKAVEQELPMGRQRRTASTQGNSSRPRWQRHDMIVYIALCNIPGQVACRAELLKAAIDLDRKISKEKGIPHVFKGKVAAKLTILLITDRLLTIVPVLALP
ncbi:hypothetical protein DSO57_1005743 [Entomophthora muscae]|uniref:Uncharacterized protein n=1 Tax=Entomophthora muscae TaxID=34485 RepID=A0ACC2U6E2_9FUNG|nr:hypothetical protein DSO57_1005743 [Entomophthora muscae]